MPVAAVKRHRKLGPLLVLAGCLGFFAGLSLVFIDEGNVLEYPLHLLVGLAIVLCLISTYMLSLRIKGPTSPVRTLHFILGITILCLYVIQAFIGLGILL